MVLSETKIEPNENAYGSKIQITPPIKLGYLRSRISGVVAGGGQGGTTPPSDKFLGALKSKRGAKIRNSNVKYYTKYVKSSLSTISKIVM